MKSKCCIGNSKIYVYYYLRLKNIDFIYAIVKCC